MRLRVIPELVFCYDPSLDRAMQIEELLGTIREDDEAECDPGTEPREEEDE